MAKRVEVIGMHVERSYAPFFQSGECRRLREGVKEGGKKGGREGTEVQRYIPDSFMNSCYYYCYCCIVCSFFMAYH